MTCRSFRRRYGFVVAQVQWTFCTRLYIFVASALKCTSEYEKSRTTLMGSCRRVSVWLHSAVFVYVSAVCCMYSYVHVYVLECSWKKQSSTSPFYLLHCNSILPSVPSSSSFQPLTEDPPQRWRRWQQHNKVCSMQCYYTWVHLTLYWVWEVCLCVIVCLCVGRTDPSLCTI